MRAHSEGIICLSACLSGEVQRKLLNRDYKGAREEAVALREIFGEENFYLELQDHGLDDEKSIRADQLRLADELGIPLVATNDVHYVDQEDWEPHDVLLCIQTGSVLSDEDRMRYPSHEFYLQERRGDEGTLPRSSRSNREYRKDRRQCNFDFVFGEYHLPEFIAPDGYTNEEYFRALCEKGLKERYGERAASPGLRKRLEYEIDTIEKMGYVDYFLIVWDFIHYAKEHGIMVGPEGAPPRAPS